MSADNLTQRLRDRAARADDDMNLASLLLEASTVMDSMLIDLRAIQAMHNLEMNHEAATSLPIVKDDLIEFDVPALAALCDRLEIVGMQRRIARTAARAMKGPDRKPVEVEVENEVEFVASRVISYLYPLAMATLDQDNGMEDGPNGAD